MKNTEKLAEIKKLVAQVLRKLKKSNVAVEIYFVGDEEMRTMHGRNATVLAYPEPKGIPHPETKKEFLGEIYLNPGYIKEKGEDVRHLAIHGLLHLLGYDHKKRNDMIKMEKKERQLIKSLISKL